ncbi:hypothetical protein KQI52_08205 [bacterium]|nr:hypothetical protein [bacterium]
MNTMTFRLERFLSRWIIVSITILAFMVILSSLCFSQTQQEPIHPTAFSVQTPSLNTSVPSSEINGDVRWIPVTDPEQVGLTAAAVAALIDAVYAGESAGSTFAAVVLSQTTGDLTIVYNDTEGQTPVPVGGFPIPEVGSFAGIRCVPAVYQYDGKMSRVESKVTTLAVSTTVWVLLIGYQSNVSNGTHIMNEQETTSYQAEWDASQVRPLDR